MKTRLSPFVAASVVFLVPLALTDSARAHVRYVTPDGNPIAPERFLTTVLSDPLNLFILGTGAVLTVLAVAVYLRTRPVRADIEAFREGLADYRDLVPWLLRLSVGLPLVGAGFSGYFFSPVVKPPMPVFVRLFGITVGFLLLFGLMTRLVATVGLLGYLVGLVVTPDLLLAFEFVPGLLAIALLGGGRPSADEIIACMAEDEDTLYSTADPLYRRVVVPFSRLMEPFAEYISVVIRVGVAFSFLYLALAEKLLRPGDALSVVAKYNLTDVVPVVPELWVVGAALAELAIGTALLFGAFTRACSLVALTMFVMTLYGLPDDPVLAHISLFGLISVLLVTGAGPFSVDELLHRSRKETAPKHVAPDTD